MIKKGSKNGALDPVLELLPIRGPEGHPALRVYSLDRSERDKQTSDGHRTREHLLFDPSTVDRGWYTIGPFGTIQKVN